MRDNRCRTIGDNRGQLVRTIGADNRCRTMADNRPDNGQSGTIGAIHPMGSFSSSQIRQTPFARLWRLGISRSEAGRRRSLATVPAATASLGVLPHRLGPPRTTAAASIAASSKPTPATSPLQSPTLAGCARWLAPAPIAPIAEVTPHRNARRTHRGTAWTHWTSSGSRTSRRALRGRRGALGKWRGGRMEQR